MANLGITDFNNLVFEGGIVDLSDTTVSFCKLILSFANEFYRIYHPEILVVFIDCFTDLFCYIVDTLVGALTLDENIPCSEFIYKDVEFVIDTVLPIVGAKINEKAGLNITELVNLHTR